MDKKKGKAMLIIQLVLGVLLVCAFIFYIVGEICLPPENVSRGEACQILEADWVRVLPDGTTEPMEIPGECDAKYGEWVEVRTILPQNQEDTYYCIRSLQQDFKIYIEDELREEYSTVDSQLFGKTSTISYVFFKIKKSDAGKALRIEFMSRSSYAGFFSEIYVGDKAEIWKYFIGLYVPTLFISVVMMFIGIVVIFGSIVIHIFYKRDVELLHLGNTILIAATWLVAESRLRQFVMPNSTIAVYLGFFMIMLLPYPFLSYVNKIQRYRYQKVYMVIAVGTLINIAVSLTLQLLGIKDFFETMGISHAIIIALIVVLAVTIGLDIRKGYIKEYRMVAFGFVGLMISGIAEIAMVYTNSAHFNGIPLCMGLVFLLIIAGMRSVRDMLMIEKEKQSAIAASESKARFLASMSHEIRTPINTVIGMNEMILRENHDATIEEYAHNIKSASQMLLGLINDVLDFSKIEAGMLQLSEDNYRLAAMLNDVILGIEARMKEKNLTLELEIDETMPAVLWGDEIRIKQILNNLLSNAVKYTERGSVIFAAKGIHTQEGFSLLMSVTDTGIGIKKDDMERLFDSFQRLELTKNRYIEGSGLGLHITKQLLDNMNGTIEVKSEYGKGSCFTVQIPQLIVDEASMGKLRQKSQDEHKESIAEKFLYAPHAKVLIVDDNKMNLRVMGALLKRSRIQLDFAPGGNECLQMTKNKKYDLILMDHMMPEPDGVQTLHLLRDEKENPNRETPVIVLTANAIAGIETQYMKEGFADYLSKPVKVDKLEEMLSKYLNVEYVRAEDVGCL